MLRLAPIAAFAALLLWAAPAAADVALSVPPANLEKSLVCKRLAGAERAPVLLVPGTSETPAMFDWNWVPYLESRGWPYCTVELPEAATGDVQTNAEYVAHAIRRMFALTGRRVQVVGHSQGGMVPRWVLKWWPDTRAMVDDLVGLAASNHGTETAKAPCSSPDGCAESFWQQTSGSRFLTALNEGGETFAGISYTVAFTRYDTIVVPNADARSGSSALRTGDGAIANVLVQDLCPANSADHLAMGTYDPVAHAVAVDALEHAGPADPGRLDAAVCSAPFMPGVDTASFASDYAAYAGDVADATRSARRVRAEPELRCYVAGSCPPAAIARARVVVSPRYYRRGRATRATIRGAIAYRDGRRPPAAGAIVIFGARRVQLPASGRVTISVRFGATGLQKARIYVPTVGEGRKTVRVLRP